MGYRLKGFNVILHVRGILVFVSSKPPRDPAPAVSNLALGVVLIAEFLVQPSFKPWQDLYSSRVVEPITANATRAQSRHTRRPRDRALVVGKHVRNTRGCSTPPLP
ncbi:hypothetical protein PG993_011061 [Apiospora rasikravindrae]|uniref:Uncharacterized protein n=1 Tax=Apiospora rasikravindrae TaxID=990691 RepID=A0ABR1SD72_9PEZI